MAVYELRLTLGVRISKVQRGISKKSNRIVVVRLTAAKPTLVS